MSPSTVHIAIVGPTATGKSELALDLADALTREGGSATGLSGVEVLNGDYGITGFDGSSETLTIKNSTVTTEGTDGSIDAFDILTLDGCNGLF